MSRKQRTPANLRVISSARLGAGPSNPPDRASHVVPSQKKQKTVDHERGGNGVMGASLQTVRTQDVDVERGS